MTYGPEYRPTGLRSHHGRGWNGGLHLGFWGWEKGRAGEGGLAACDELGSVCISLGLVAASLPTL